MMITGYFNILNGPNGQIPRYYQGKKYNLTRFLLIIYDFTIYLIFKGSAKISNAQMIRIGQIPGGDMPTMSVCQNGLSLYNLGTNNGTRIQYVKNSSFTNGFDCAIAIDAVADPLTITQPTMGIIVENNVFFESATPFVTFGQSNIIRSNLVVGTNGNQAFINNAIIAEDNFFAGVGFAFSGDSCPYGNQFPTGITMSVKNNIVHGQPKAVSLNGPDMMNPENNLGCLRISGFTIYKSSSYAINYKGPFELLVDNNILIDNHVGLYATVIGPPSLTHAVGNKKVKIENNLIVGQSQTYSCEDDSNIWIQPLSFSYWGAGLKFDSKIGVVWSAFVDSYDPLWSQGM